MLEAGKNLYKSGMLGVKANKFPHPFSQGQHLAIGPNLFGRNAVDGRAAAHQMSSTVHGLGQGARAKLRHRRMLGGAATVRPTSPLSSQTRILQRLPFIPTLVHGQNVTRGQRQR